jgi:hypothetical protein
MQGWDAAAAAIVAFWIEDIARYQIHRYVAGIQPIRSISNVRYFL